MDVEEFLAGLVGLIVLFFIIWIPISMQEQKNELKKEAVKSGAAYYKVNDEGTAIFTWKHLEKAEK